MKRKFMFIILSFFLWINVCKCVTKAPIDVTTSSIYDLLDAMDKGYITSESLVNIYLERIEEYDDMFNSISIINDNAIEEARELDKLRSEGKLKGKLHGIPILVKSNIDVKGIATNAGTRALMNNYPNSDSTVVERLKNEGAIILGSCNMSALAFSASQSSGSFGRVKNVFDINKTPFGSSGGSAVAVAAAFAAASLGTDTNSSVRAPSSAAGLVGIRPTYGLVSHTGVIPYDFERDTVGVLSRTVSDNALLLGIIGGEDTSDNTTKSVKVDNYDVSDASLLGVKIGVLTQYVKGSSSESGMTSLTDSEIYNLLEKSIKELEENGAEIVYLDNFVKYSNLSIASSTMAGGTMCDYFNEYIKGSTGPIRSFKDLVNSGGSVWDLSGYLSSCGVRVNGKSQRDTKKEVYANYTLEYFDEYDLDVLLYPTVKNKVPLESNSSGNLFPGSSFGSVIGFPSITVPMGKASDGVSYGIEFMSKTYNEKMLYNVAASYEKVNGNEPPVTSLAPSLYEIPDSVKELVIKYENRLSSNGNGDQEWINKVKDFFVNYNSYDDVSGKALELIKLETKNSVSFYVFTDYVTNNKEQVVYWLLVGLVIICGIIIVKDIIF